MEPFIQYLKHILRPSISQRNPSTEDRISKAIHGSDVPARRSLLETQDRHLFTQLAQYGSPEAVAFALSRHPNPIPPDLSEHVPKPDPILHPLQFLVLGAASNGNTALFRYLVTEHHLLSHNRNTEHILFSAITGGGVPIWKIILEVEPQWKDHEFYEHHGVVLEKVVQFGGPDKKELLQFLLDEGAELCGVGDPPLKTLRALGAEKDILDMAEKYC